MTGTLADILKYFTDKQVIRQLDYQFAMFIARQCQLEKDEIAWMSALVSYELGQGHICVPVYDQQGQFLPDWLYFGLSEEASRNFRALIESADWPGVIQRCPLIGEPGTHSPLVFDGYRLYLHRYWYYESHLAARLRQLSVPVIPENPILLQELLGRLFVRDYQRLWQQKASLHTREKIQDVVCDLFDVVDGTALDWESIEQVIRGAKTFSGLKSLDALIPEHICLNWQKVAAAIALSRQFTVISGGPGTGKTTTVARLLAALVAQASGANPPIIRLVAPTGKAAARLTESISRAVEQLPVSPEMKAMIPVQAATVHRLLGAVQGSAEFLHHEGNQLHVDILVVDEASMVDLPMMYKLIMALPLHTRVILLGDKDQLASVEAGAVLGDICTFQSCGYSASQADLLTQLTGYRFPVIQKKVPNIADGLCMLQKSYRFDADSGIGLLAKIIHDGDDVLLSQICRQSYSDIQIYSLESGHYNQMLEVLLEEYSSYLAEIHQGSVSESGVIEPVAKSVLQLFNRCRLLCALRDGDFGVSGLNQRIEHLLDRRGLIQRNQELWYEGRPVMVTKNDHYLGIYNGDIGICLKTVESGKEVLKVYFEQFDGSVKGFIPSRLPAHETAYAMTIHKSQGSEFDFTLMVLPPDFSPVLTRELIYTGITRAKSKLSLYADFSVLKRAIHTKTKRISGLFARLSEW